MIVRGSEEDVCVRLFMCGMDLFVEVLYCFVDQCMCFGCVVLVIELYWIVFCWQFFVDLEEGFDVLMFDFWQIFQIVDSCVGWVNIVGWYVDDFFIVFVVVDYFQVIDGLEMYDYVWMQGFVGQYQCIQWIIVIGQGVWD